MKTSSPRASGPSHCQVGDEVEPYGHRQSCGLYDRLLVAQPYERGAPQADRLEGCMLPAPGVAVVPLRLTTGFTGASSSLSSLMTVGPSSSSSSSVPRLGPVAGVALLSRIVEEKGVGVVVRVAVL